MAAIQPGRHSWRLHISHEKLVYRPRRDERLGEPRPGFEPTTTKSRIRPRLGSNPQPRDPESNALTLTLTLMLMLMLMLMLTLTLMKTESDSNFARNT